MKCEVCGQEYGVSHNYPGLSQRRCRRPKKQRCGALQKRDLVTTWARR
jgi:hypothetical protein